jgi:hypothetical protein
MIARASRRSQHGVGADVADGWAMFQWRVVADWWRWRIIRCGLDLTWLSTMSKHFHLS